MRPADDTSQSARKLADPDYEDFSARLHAPAKPFEQAKKLSRSDWGCPSARFTPSNLAFGFETFKMEMAQGRSFSRAFPSDTASAVIVNEEAVRVMGLAAPLETRFEAGGLCLPHGHRLGPLCPDECARLAHSYRHRELSSRQSRACQSGRGIAVRIARSNVLSTPTLQGD